MEVIWQQKLMMPRKTAIRLIMDDDGCIMFQYRFVDLPEWTDVDEVPIQFKFAVSDPSPCRRPRPLSRLTNQHSLYLFEGRYTI
jgi:hypothetical protein